jgi:hypothetical protein
MVAIVKDNGKLKNPQVKTQEKTIKAKKVAAPESSDDDDDDSSSSEEEEIKIDLKKAAIAKSTPTPVKQPVKVIKKEASESDSDDDDDDDEDEDEDDESEEETKVKPVKKTVDLKNKVPVKQESDDDEEEEEKLVIHPKNGVNNRNNGFNKPGANSKEDEIINEKLKEIATDVKSNEAAEKGDFKLFNLPANLIEKLKAKKITYLYPIQIATLTHIRAGHDVIAQASKSLL